MSGALRSVVRFLVRAPHVHIPAVADDAHHRCYCTHRRDAHLGMSGWCDRCGCSHFQALIP